MSLLDHRVKVTKENMGIITKSHKLFNSKKHNVKFRSILTYSLPVCGFYFFMMGLQMFLLPPKYLPRDAFTGDLRIPEVFIVESYPGH